MGNEREQPWRMFPQEAGDFSDFAVCHDPRTPDELIGGYYSRRSTMLTKPENGSPDEQWWRFANFKPLSYPPPPPLPPTAPDTHAECTIYSNAGPWKSPDQIQETNDELQDPEVEVYWYLMVDQELGPDGHLARNLMIQRRGPYTYPPDELCWEYTSWHDAGRRCWRVASGRYAQWILDVDESASPTPINGRLSARNLVLRSPESEWRTWHIELQ